MHEVHIPSPSGKPSVETFKSKEKAAARALKLIGQGVKAKLVSLPPRRPSRSANPENTSNGAVSA